MAFRDPFFQRVEARSLDERAYARGWIANRDGVYDDARRGYGGQSRTAARLFDLLSFREVDRIGWVSSFQSDRRGSGASALQRLLYRFDEAAVEVTGLIVFPDDDIFVPRLVSYYGRFGFEPIDLEEQYGSSDYPILVRQFS